MDEQSNHVQKEEPWLVLDAGKQRAESRVGTVRLLVGIQTALEYIGIAVYYAVSGGASAAIGAMAIATISHAQVSCWWMLPVSAGILVSLASGLLAVCSMMKTRTEWRAAEP